MARPAMDARMTIVGASLRPGPSDPPRPPEGTTMRYLTSRPADSPE
ncbi:hypothetical protein GCM10009760_39400 [Kitasatospora kazusensis]|uniref:Uncharacterized protein n=1 Tax=Kitasatospora kazusensis TaxID=407974 RepID=A0ABN2ZUV5_9ACTN